MLEAIAQLMKVRRQPAKDLAGHFGVVDVRAALAVLEHVEPELFPVEKTPAVGVPEGTLGAGGIDAFALQESPQSLPEQLECELEALDRAVHHDLIGVGMRKCLTEPVQRVA